MKFVKDNLASILILIILAGAVAYICTLPEPEPDKVNVEKVINKIIDKVKE